ncbi:hypothetical protein FD755_008934 [Muntiacus reevesi]|uniref:Uncharacterized protein n=1 Tax=Muntiacus reevesi TaxID=9886 RepID=A0A5J5MLU6_MUNRE|nr:hypothetical protein FD755_008934 [Muntiacus reevesi]
MQKSTNSDTPVETLNPTRQGTGAVQMRIKNANSHHDRPSQSKSMILTDAGKVTEPFSKVKLAIIIPAFVSAFLASAIWMPSLLDSLKIDINEEFK